MWGPQLAISYVHMTLLLSNWDAGGGGLAEAERVDSPKGVANGEPELHQLVLGDTSGLSPLSKHVAGDIGQVSL